MWEFISSPALQTVLLGSALLGAVSGALGSFAVLRRQSLIGDAVSHAALPGIAIAFLLFGDAPLLLLVGAAMAGWLALLGVRTITERSRLPFDATLGGMLAVLFGLGLVLMSWIQRNAQGAGTAGLDRYLFGQAAAMLTSDVRAIALLGLLSLGTLMLLWKELKLLSFDPEFAAVQGWPIAWLDRLRLALLVLAIVIGLQSVGVVLMSALLVAPATAARQWTDRLGRMVLLAGIFGAGAGIFGTLLSHHLSVTGRSVPTGPTIVLCAGVWVVVSLLGAMLRAGLRKRVI